MMQLAGKVAIITGAGRGLGRAAAVAMSGEAAAVVLCSRTQSDLDETARRIRKAGGRVAAVRADVSLAKDVQRVKACALRSFGRIDILMNNAAIIGPLKPLWNIRPSEWDGLFRINLRGVYLAVRAVVPAMKKQGGGKIINVTSGLAEMVLPLFGVYGVSKAALNHLTRVLAEELRGDAIRVNGLDPGVMDTSMQDGVRGAGPDLLGWDLHREFVAMKDEGRLKRPEQVARLAVFLASPASDGITGEIGTERDYQRYGFQTSRM